MEDEKVAAGIRASTGNISRYSGGSAVVKRLT